MNLYQQQLKLAIKQFSAMSLHIQVFAIFKRKCSTVNNEGMMAIYNQSEYKEERIAAFKKIERVILGIIK